MRIPTVVVVLLLALAGAWTFVGPRRARAVRLESPSTDAPESASGQVPVPPGAAMEDDAGLEVAATAEEPTKMGTPDAPARTADLVVLVSLDGLRPDVMGPNTRALHRLYLQGASAHLARTIRKSATLPSHASMVSGVDVSEHGLNFNSFKPERGTIQVPTIFSVVHAAGLPSTMYVGKTKLRHLLARKDDAEFNMGGMRCDGLLNRALPALREARRGLMFLHFADPDSAGHRVGWMTDSYLEAVQKADRCLDRVIHTIAASPNADRTLLVVTADHGGHKRSHGTGLDVDQRIPWFAWGAGVRRGRFARTVNTVDTAATVLNALGLNLPEGMHGTPVFDAFASALGPQGLGLFGTPFEPALP